jgi:hypothetical protein
VGRYTLIAAAIGVPSMSEPSTNKPTKKRKVKRKPTDLQVLTDMRPIVGTTLPLTSVAEAYKKHAAELASIEDRQYKLTLLMLGIFSAGLTFVASGHVALTCSLRWWLIVFAFAIVIPSLHYNWELHNLRGLTRELLVRCEIALGFHEQNLFLKDHKLYAEGDLDYGTKGGWLRFSYYSTVGAACLAFVLIVAFVKADAASTGRDQPCAAGLFCSSATPSKPAPQK